MNSDELIKRRFDYVHVSDRLVEDLLPSSPAIAWSADAPLAERQETEARQRKEQQEAHSRLKKELEDLVGDAFVRGVEMATDRDAYRAYRARSVVLLLVVLAVVAMPIVAILTSLSPEDFGTFVAPITGIAGTVVGFWFSSAKGTSSRE